MIGKHYSINYNCAHFVAEWYREKLNIEIPVENEFELSFVRWLRNNFEQVNEPVENCMVRMSKNKVSHIGVYADNGVYHNYKPATVSNGAVVHWPLGVTQRNYDEVTYWVWK